jgi:hypothetical protein
VAVVAVVTIRVLLGINREEVVVLAAAVQMMLKVVLEHLDKVIMAVLAHTSRTIHMAEAEVVVLGLLVEIIAAVLAALVGLVHPVQ